MTTYEFRSLVAWLRKHFPIDSPVIVKRYPSKKNHGVTHFDGKRYYIRIDSVQEESSQIDSLLHEWSHAVAIADAYSHKESWAQVYSKIYTAHETKDANQTDTSV